MTITTAKRNAGAAVKDIIEAARRYIEAERALENALKTEHDGGSTPKRRIIRRAGCGATDE